MTNYRDLATEFSLVFDLDGTLIDSAPDLQAAVNTVLSSHGLRLISMEETQAFIYIDLCTSPTYATSQDTDNSGVFKRTVGY